MNTKISTKHTPGPWGFERTMIHSEHEAENIFAGDGSGGYIAGVWKGPNAVADARLMTAAPDMLEALKQTTDQIEADNDSSGLGGRGALVRKARAAIAKAESR